MFLNVFEAWSAVGEPRIRNVAFHMRTDRFDPKCTKITEQEKKIREERNRKKETKGKEINS